ncbi:SDR family mycofactocin-dependent oxidoreductase [Rhodococcus sp. PvR044]|jgi:SDR family mycofactocin-dependent oxidoreductase|uniref:NAD(P)-dependent oxidoreductase n=1 Tax=Rhodococcus oryzae TaxID=2571143 RepID=A0ABY2RF11_9NOCA|nr:MULTISPECIES: mycofactocin-coupled SDR family oxidoreductase [Rhodococcus]MBP1159187.1 SDR family mycofactocin-dependent oxidoreductase [Rhodococcus sp. PvR099]MCZ4558657.1 mycofactocin-coupled SDR family oxidoreductase [Rhodococcus maanshanensis]PTR36120.1 SDR family mycofactocin-dependent oxidoreductase [Rhodococcus sp. OK611]TJZ74983.1 NAD(P)-dependent oxidoreductase [Rhodococcus oryzae]SNX94101.1 SDR family mycofactocin-dependent oxidoreductase [Rhodococcus sp. OK270]
MANRFEGKVAFITGAARGQGRAEAVKFAQGGADIIALDACIDFDSTPYAGATEEDLAETVRLVEEQGRKIVATKADVRDFAAVTAALDAGVEAFGRLDYVVANAGICSAALSWEITPEQWQETIDVNLTGVFFTCKAAIPKLIEQGEGGSIVVTSSVSSLKGAPFFGHYVASKAGIAGLTRTMANELGMHRIRVNSVHPYGVATGMVMSDVLPLMERFAETLAPAFIPSLPDGFSQPEDVANVVAFLCSDEAHHITGINMPIDLGNAAR